MNRSTPGHPVHHQLPILGEFFDAIVNGIILFHFSIFPSINRSSCRFLDIGVYSPALVKVLVHHSCPTLCNPMDCSPPGFSVCGISQARILEWVASSLSRGSSWFRDQTRVSCIGRWVLYCWATREAPGNRTGKCKCSQICKVLVTQSCPTLCDPMDCSPPRSSCPGKNTGVGCHFLLQKL